MVILTYNNVTYECSVALKGADYIHLLNDAGIMTAAFDGVVDFSAFKLVEGTYTEPLSDDDCHVAVFREDGTLAKGGHRCRDIMPNRVTVLPESGVALADNTLYIIPKGKPVGVHTFTPPSNGWCHGTFYTGATPVISFSNSSFMGALPDFEADCMYEFDVLNGVWAFAEVIE